MNQNIFQVVSEEHIDEIFDQYKQNLIVVMLSSKTCPPCVAFKPKFISLSKQYKDIFFVYIDLTNYKMTQGKYFREFNSTPTFIFYFNNNKIVDIVGVHESAFMKLMLEIKQKIDVARQQFQQEEKMLENQKVNDIKNLDLNRQMQNQSRQLDQMSENSNKQNNQNMNMPDSELLNKKMILLNKLRELINEGYKPTKNYNLDSDYNEIMLEIQYLTNSRMQPTSPAQPSFNNQMMHQQQPQHQRLESDIVEPQKSKVNNNMYNSMNDPTIQQELHKKQEQIRQIHELDMLHQNMQMENYKKLQELRRMKMMKEQRDKNNHE